MTTFRIAALGAALWLSAVVWADTIYFKDGSSLDGSVRRETRRRVVLQVPGGSMSFPLDDIDRIEENDKVGIPDERSKGPADGSQDAPPAPALPALTKDDERALRAMLNDLLDMTPAVRDGARDRLIRFGTEHDVFPFLERALPYLTDRQAVDVLEVVAKLDPVRAKPILLDATTSMLAKNRAKAVGLLGSSLGDAGTHDLDLLRLFARGTLDPSLDVQLAAIKALQDSQDRRATPALLRCMENADRRVQSAGLTALRALWQPEETYKHFETPAQWRMLLEFGDEEIRESLEPTTLTPLVETPKPGDEDYNLGIE